VASPSRTLFAAHVAALAAATLNPLCAFADSPSSGARRATAGGLVRFTVPAGGARTCTVQAGRQRRTADVAGAARVRVSFRVASRARTGTWRLSVTCAPGVARQVDVTVAGARRRKAASGRLIAGAIHLERIFPAHPDPLIPAPKPRMPTVSVPPVAASLSEADALARAHADWATYGTGYLAVFRNGQCTDWAAQKRPDIVEAATVRAWADHLMGLPDPGVSWNGGFWDDMARAARLPVGTTPKAGAIVTFDPGTLGASPITGHVAFVESVDDVAGTFTISEMNAPVAWMISYRTIRTSEITDGGITFVY
jgi:surface antigen